MKIPFTVDQFMNVFARYNMDVWPLQILFLLLALTAIGLCIRTSNWSSRIIASILGLLWLWIGIVYHIVYFAQINKAAYVFGALNVVQAFVFMYYGAVRGSLTFRFKRNLFGIIGAVLILYALLIYPLLGYNLGHVYPQSPTFGVPCPTTIFTFGILLWADKRVPIPVVILPLLWSLIGFTAALSLGIVEDIGLVITGVIGTLLIVVQNKRRATLPT